MKQVTFAEESQWVESLRSGDAKGFEKIYNHYWAKLFSIAYNYTRSRETAQEILQEVFVSIWLKRTTLPEQLNLKGYLYQAIRHKIYDHYDKQVVREQYAVNKALHEPVMANTTEQQVAFDELNTLLDQQIEVLPETTRKVFILSRMHGFTIPEISREIQMPVKTVEYHLSKALKFLRYSLADLLILIFIVQF
ncbi:RNA polymerase sigma-70 factor [Rhodocytophaga rosea]|uniref:RNA polymerase sigma-70 factor n=1 Tax=Rhodocytophaga rosea TaxID=2704465 RepID=A0A6C0GIC3_9BACT|nr:RNA polymerase sigma-70 factor [Rhodocytophaga rosea]QHT67480.1 RNA polymerase sigma-70 factor [Rhodocytophaga rosea]